MHKVYLLLGSNIGDHRKIFPRAYSHIKKEIGPIARKSHLYQTAPWGNTKQPDFINQVITVSCKMTAIEVIKVILEIEEKMGRVRTTKNAPRVIDIDILFFDKEIINEKLLTVPHPGIAKRRFTLVPLNELSPGFIHPVLQKSIHHLLLNCPDSLDVKKI